MWPGGSGSSIPALRSKWVPHMDGEALQVGNSTVKAQRNAGDQVGF